MNDDYLWDQSGPPDPETVRLEETLAPFRYRMRPLDLQRAPRGAPRGAAGKLWRWMAAAAAVVVVAGGGVDGGFARMMGGCSNPPDGASTAPPASRKSGASRP